MMQTNSETKNAAETKPARFQAMYDYAMKRPCFTDQDFQRAGNDVAQNWVFRLNNLYNASIVFIVTPSHERAGRFEWQFIASLRLARTMKSIKFEIAGSNYTKILNDYVALAGKDAGNPDTGTIVKKPAVLRLVKDLTDAEELFVMQHQPGGSKA